MFGNRKQNSRQGRQQSGSSPAVCICPHCGYSTLHVVGVTCRSYMCPSCMVLLLRRETSKESTISTNQKQSKSTQAVPTSKYTATQGFPVVDRDLCIGCKACVKICPTNDISLIDEKAVINNEHCKNCRKCVSRCPVGAIK